MDFDSPIEQWCAFLKNVPKPIMERIKMKNQEISKADDTFKQLIADPKVRAQIEAHEKLWRDRQNEVDAALLKGRLEGELAGEIKKSLSIALKMLKNKFSLNDIIECTGLSKEQINSLHS